MTKSETPEEENSKHAGGRPLKFETVAALDMAIQIYFDRCDPHVEPQMIATGVSGNGKTMFDTREVLTEQKPYTMSGLARALGVSRQTLLDYSNRDEFLDSIQMAKQRCEEFAEGQLFGPYANGAKFNLVNNYRGKHQDWSDKQVLAGDPDAPLMPIGLDSAILARMQDRGKAPQVATEDSGE